MRGIGLALKDAWRLSRPYFMQSEQRWSARGLLALIVAMNLGMVGITVVFSFWSRDFYNSLQEHDWNAFIALMLGVHRTANGIMPGYVILAFLYVSISAYQLYLQRALQVRWRQWTTDRLLRDWLDDQTYYRMSLTDRGTDNPDQRIAEDLRLYADYTLTLGLEFMRNAITLVSFIGILWSLSGPLELFGIAIPGYMVWVCVIFSALGTWLAHLVGRTLVPLYFEKQRVEADYRFALVRLRENAEGIAFYHGEADERAGLTQRFAALARNWWAVARREKNLNFFTFGYERAGIVFPYLVAAPQFFGGSMTLGALQQTAQGFSQVQVAMSWFVGAYARLAEWRATVERLSGFLNAIRTTPAMVVRDRAEKNEALHLEDVCISTPAEQTLLSGATLTVQPRQHTLISGPTGSGKSTLLRAIAGLWPFTTGRITLPAGDRFLFLPQRPYMPLGTLRNAIAYPLAGQAVAPDTLSAVLDDVGLGYLAARLDDEQNWMLALSGGEQQRLAIARALLVRPDWLFLDEATASLDNTSEDRLYTLLRTHLPETTLISIAHRTGLARFHEQHLVVTPQDDGAALLQPAPI